MSSNAIDPISRPGAQRHHDRDELRARRRHVRDQRADEERRRGEGAPEECFEHGRCLSSGLEAQV